MEQRLRPVGFNDLKALLALKKEEHEEQGYPFDGQFYIWDYRYYDRKFIERTLNLDDQLVKEYFPVSVVVPAILDIYQGLLGVKFVETKGETWHPGLSLLFMHVCKSGSPLFLDVQQFSVWDKDAKDEKGFLGYCYLDLFPRGMCTLSARAMSSTHQSQLPNIRMLLCGVFFHLTTSPTVRRITLS